MRPLILAASVSIALAGVAGEAAANCAAPSVRVNTKATLGALLTGNTVCVPATTVPDMTWQELHAGGPLGGDLVDFKRGPLSKTDPSEKVGTWSVDGLDNRGVFVTHDYGRGGSYTYSVWRNADGTHSFCSTNPEIVAKIKPGGNGC